MISLIVLGLMLWLVFRVPVRFDGGMTTCKRCGVMKNRDPHWFIPGEVMCHEGEEDV